MTGDLARINLFHRHRWQMKEKTEQASAWEVLTSVVELDYVTMERAGDLAFYARPVIVTYVCADCRSEKVERV